MKLRDMMFLVIGGLLVISGMVLNTLLSGDVEAQGGLKDGRFRNIVCEGIVVKGLGIVIVDNELKPRGYFGVSANGSAMLEMTGDNEKRVAYLGGNPYSTTKEMNFYLQSQSKTDKRMVVMAIDENGGVFQSNNKMGEEVVRIVVGDDGDDGDGGVETKDKFVSLNKILQ